jgi:hypothetical protein
MTKFKLWKLRWRHRPGWVARALLKMGDLDVTREGGGRLKIAAKLMNNELRVVRAVAISITEKPRRKLAGLQRHIGIRSEERGYKNEQRIERIEQGRLWRKLGIYEKILHLDLPGLVRVCLYLFLGGLDFYVFAEAWAIGTDSVTGEVIWWVGGLVGLVVFLAGFFAAVQLKRVVVARRQRELLEETGNPDSKLVLLAPNLVFLAISMAFFLLMVALGLLVRLSNESEEANVFMVAMAAMIPLLAAVAELFLYDPMHRSEVRPNLIDRVLAFREARVMRKLEIRNEKIEQILEAIREHYETEIEILKVELKDRGIQPEGQSSQEGVLI